MFAELGEMKNDVEDGGREGPDEVEGELLLDVGVDEEEGEAVGGDGGGVDVLFHYL